MKGLESRKIVGNIISNLIISDKENVYNLLKQKLINTGKMTNNQIQDFISRQVNYNEINEIYLCMVYSTLMNDTNKYFTDIEINEANNFIQSKVKNAFPFKFHNCTQTTAYGNQYKFILSIQEVNELLNSGVVKILEGMQRETEYSMYNGVIFQHVSYNDNVAREISKSILDGDFNPTDEIKIHLLFDGTEDYIVNDGTITIKNGSLVLLDGQHRKNGIQYALVQEKNLFYNFSINLSFGSKEFAQSIISQHEKRQPIDKETLKSYQNSEANNIFRDFSTDRFIERTFKFVENTDGEKANAGFIIKANVIDAIRKYYKTKGISNKEQMNISDWLVTFFKTFYSLYDTDIDNFREIKNKKWNVRSYAWDGFIYLSSILYNNDNGIEIAKDILNNIDFSSEINAINKSTHVKKIIESVVNKYVK